MVIAAADLGLIGITFHERFAHGNRVLLGYGYVCAKPDGRRGSDSERCTDHVMLSILNRRMEEPYAYARTVTSGPTQRGKVGMLLWPRRAPAGAFFFVRPL